MKYDDERHIDDVLCDDRVIEFQKSKISSVDMQKREQFYTKIMKYKMCWVFCCTRDTNIDIIIQKHIGDVICCKWRSGTNRTFLCAKVTSYIDLGNMDLLLVLHVKKDKFIARIVRFYEFENEWYTSKYINKNNILNREPTCMSRSKTLSDIEIKNIKREYLK
jgi:hypothetical protein